MAGWCGVGDSRSRRHWRAPLIYALSSAAVAAASAAGSGGTWAGAIENIKQRWVPTFVRQDSSAGSRELQLAGALALAPRTVAEVDIHELFRAHEPTLLARDAALGGTRLEHAPNGHRSPALEDIDAGDVFEHVWPLIAARLQSPRSDREVAQELHLQLGQVRTWLERAVREGLVSSRTRPRKLYVVSEHEAHQLRLG